MRLSRRQFLCAAAVELSLAACGTMQSTESMTLKVAQNSAAFSYFPISIATQQGFFKAQGLTFNPSPIPITGNGAKTAPAIESGNVEVAFGTVTDAFTLSRVDATIKMIGSLCNGFTIDLIVSNAFLAETGLTEASSLERKVKALVGRKIGISSPGTATEGFLIYLLRQYGYDYRKDITEVNLGNVTPTTALAALANKRVDAVSWPIPAGQVAQAQKIGKRFISPVLGDVPAMREMLYGVIYTRQSVIDAKPKAIAALLRALAQAEAFIHHDPKQTSALLKQFLKLDSATTDAVAHAALSAMPTSPLISQQAYNTANQFHVKAGLIAIALGYNDLVATDTINHALVQGKK